MEFYPEIEPYRHFRLKVSDIHELYVEEVGNPNGQPVVFLHGGPGGGCTEHYRRFFDPKHYRVILFDQRGAGRSTPHAELEENDTWKLVEDIETIRKELNIEKWIVFGGSWGSTLSLTYAIKYPEAVNALVLRGIFLCRPHEIKWFYQEGASRIFPDKWEKYINAIPEEERGDLVEAFYKRLTSDDKKTRLQAAQAWSVWEGSTSYLIPDEEVEEIFGGDEFALAFARIECHYFTNNIFMPEDNWIIKNLNVIKDIPSFIVHGRYDVVCPVENAWEIHKELPNSQLVITPNSGHSAFEPQTRTQLINWMEELKNKI